MTDDSPKFCADHSWSGPRTVWVEDAQGEYVEHPTEKVRICRDCPAQVSVEKEPK